MNAKQKKLLILYLILILLIIGAAVCMAVIRNSVEDRQTGDYLEEIRDQIKDYQSTAPDTLDTDDTGNSSDTDTTAPDGEVDEPDTEEATLDFDLLWQSNSDICAWIEIEGTKVDYPVLQNPDDDNKYLRAALDGTYYIGGSLFTQATYNSNDFNDPVTVIYGHTMRSGTMFGQLQQIYTSSVGFSEYSDIKLYLPSEVRHYTVFAAVPYEPIHILHTYDFSNNYWYRNFFNGVYKVRSFGANLSEDIKPEPGDRVIILSTCLNQDSSKRFLVMAVHRDDISDNN